MKKRLLLLASILGLGYLAGASQPSLTKATAEPVNVISQVVGTEGLMGASDWEGLPQYALSDAEKGYVSFASISTKVFFKFYVKDDTKFTNKEKIVFEFTTNDKHQGQQGNFDPWLTGLGTMDFGNSLQIEMSYDETAHAYTAVLGYDLGDSYIVGNEFNFTINYWDATTAETEWGGGTNVNYSGKFYLGEAPAAPNTFIVPAVEGSAGLMGAADWEGVETYKMAGANKGTVAFAAVGSNLIFRMQVEDATKFTNKDKIDYQITIGSKHMGQQGNFDPWLTGLGTMDYGSLVQMEMSYDETAHVYTAVIGFDIGEDMVKGAKATVEVNFHDAKTADDAWGAGPATSFNGELTLLGEADEPAPVEHTYIIPSLGDTVRDVVESDWASVEKYALEGANEGYVALAAIGTDFVIRFHVNDTTKFTNKERIALEMTLGSKHEGVQGNFDPWLTAMGAMDFGQLKQVAMGYDETNHAYDMTLSFALGDDYVVGADINFSITYQDARTAETEWGAGEASTFSHAFKLVSNEAPVTPVDPEDPPVDPQPTEGVVPGPENPNYQIVAQDLAGLPSANDWANATPYAMIPIWGDTTGASANIKVFTANNNFFWRIDATDPALHIQNDGLYIKIETVGDEPTTIMEGRGNYDNWIAWISQTCGSPSLMEISTDVTDNKAYQSGHVIMDQGFYMPDICVPEGQVHMILKYRDSRNSGEGWMDADYLHTLVFDQVITFGAKADTTVRPVDPTQGFAGSAKDISYDKATICWNEVSGADSYKIYEYLVNPQGSEEPYEHIAIDGPIYAGDASYEEEIFGLSESTAYAAQIIAYDEDGNVIGASALVLFSTISREEAMHGGGSSEPTSSEPPVTSEPTSEPASQPTSEPASEPATPSTSAPASSEPAPQQPEKKGCGSAVTLPFLALSGILFAGLAIVTKKSKND